MSPWWQSRMLGIDFETTSADPETARIVSAALVLCGGGEPTETLDLLVNPGVEIPQEAIDVHGITNERAQTDGISPEVALKLMLEFADESPPGTLLVGCNLVFDFTIWDREITRHLGDVPRPDETTWMCLDPAVLDRFLDPFRKKDADPNDPARRWGAHSLEDMCRLYDVRDERDGTHSAVVDALAACRVAWRILQRGKVIRSRKSEYWDARREWEEAIVSAADLHRAQARWYAARAENYEQYRRRGDRNRDAPPEPEYVASRDWPLVPATARVA